MHVMKGHRQATVPLIRSKISETAPGIRFCAAAALAELSPDDHRLPAILIEGLKSVDLRRRAARGLAKTGLNASAAIEPLVRGMQDDEFRIEAASALARVAPLHPALQVFLQRWRRDVALETWPPKDLILGEVDRMGIVGVGELIKFIKHRDQEIQRGAIETLGAIGPEARPALPLLVEVLGDAQQSDMHECVCAAMHKIGLDKRDLDAAPLLLEILKSNSGYLEIDELLGQLGPEIMPDLVSLVDDRRAKLWARVCAVRALGIMGTDAEPAVIPVAVFLERNTKALGPTETRWVLEALGKIGTNSPEAAQAVAAEFPWFPENAGPALRSIGAPAILPLINWLEHDRADVRRSVVKTLSEFDDQPEQIVGSLLQAARDSNFTVRQAAVTALGQKLYASPETAALLLASLRDVRMPVRAAATKSLEASAQDAGRTVPALIAALSDDYLAVRVGACRTLGGFGPAASDAVPALERIARSDEFVPARLAASEALRRISHGIK
jgi:HEAT repeat protein